MRQSGHMQLPSVVRAAVGLAAMAADEARRLPDRAIELPMLAVSTALQASLRAQQRYARLAARGDEIINHRDVTDEPPPWATFDEPVGVDELRRAAGHASAFDAAYVPEDEDDDEYAEPAEVKPLRPPRKSAPRNGTAPTNTAGKSSTTKSSTTKSTAAKSTARDTAASKSTASKSTASKSTARKSTARKPSDSPDGGA